MQLQTKDLNRSENIFSEQSGDHDIRVFTFNILAPCWADPIYYPASATSFLNRESRRAVIINLLQLYQNKVDVFALQEVAQVEFEYIQEALSSTHVGFQANHAASYWLNWVTPATPWELNGNAIFISKERFENLSFEDFPASTSGNHMALFKGEIKNSGGKILRVASVHLDSDHAYNRKRELKAVLEKWKAGAADVEILTGDFNTETDATNIQTDLQKTGYDNLLGILDNQKQTHPWGSKYYKSNNWGIIDHIMYRNAKPIDGLVMDSNLFDLFPKNEEQRIIENFKITGSDHFPVMGSIGYSTIN